MNFSIIEIKDKDLYVIYDMLNKGACCCSKYTIKELLNQGHQIYGVSVRNDKLNIVECDLQGNIREKKASNSCNDLTKRSASTISRGLDEKHYPRVKQNRSGMIGLNNPGSMFLYHTTRKSKNSEDVIKYAVPCILMPNGDMMLKSGDIMLVSEVNRNIDKFESYNPSDKVSNLFMQQYNSRLKINDLDAQINKLQGEIAKLQSLKNECSNNMRKVSDSLRLALAEEKMLEDIERYKKQVTGKEILSMSFYKGTLNTAMAIAIIQKTSRKCRYTYGLKYRNPTTRDVFISKEKAIEHIRKGSFIDVAFKDDVIDINEYSDNDMW